MTAEKKPVKRSRRKRRPAEAQASNLAPQPGLESLGCNDEVERREDAPAASAPTPDNSFSDAAGVISGLEQRLAAAVQEAGRWKGFAEERQAALAAWRDRKSDRETAPDVQASLSRERQKNAELADEIAAARHALSVRAAEIEAYRADLGDWLDVHARWEQTQVSLEARYRDLERQLADAREHVDREAREGRSGAELASLEARVNSQDSEIAVLQGETLAHREHARSLDRHTRHLEQIIADQAEQRIADSRRLGSRIRRAFGLAPRGIGPNVEKDAALIETFLASVEPHRLGVPPEGRRGRILAYLLGASASLDEFAVFDRSFYLAHNEDLAGAGVEPLVHFIRHGGAERRNPGILFDSEFYVSQAPESVALGEIPVLHYLKWGADKGKSPHPLFDTQFYLDQYPDLKLSKHNPLLHYLRYPGCVPHPLFDSAFYRSQVPELASSSINPLIHYLTVGASAGYDPHPMFNTRYYLAANPDVAAAGMNPLFHFVTSGCDGLRMPNPDFETQFYVSAYPDVAASGLNPLVHYIRIGAAEGRATSRRKPGPRPVELPDAKPIVLMIDAAYPRPDQDSGSVDQINFIEIFEKLNYRVYFVADVEFGAVSRYRDALEDRGVRCVTTADYLSIEEFIRDFGDRLSVCFLSRVHFGARHLETIRALAPRAKIIFNTVDLHYLREEREATLKNDAAALARARDTRARELQVVRAADATVVVSEKECDMLRIEAPGANVSVIPLIRDYPPVRAGGFRDRAGIGFIGGFLHEPNIDAVAHFLDRIWPTVRAALPGVVFHVIGSNLPKVLSDRGDPGVVFVGYVPDLDDWLGRLRLTVAPLRYGAGAKGKVVSSLGRGAPCVGSPIAVEGMGLVDGRDVAVAASDEDFARTVVELYGDEARWTRLSEAGFSRIREQHSLARGRDLVAGLLGSIGARTGAASR